MVGWREREEREFFFLRRIQKPRAREGSERAGARFFLSLSRSRSCLPFYTRSPSATLSSADAPSSALPLLLSRMEMPTLKKLKRKQKTLQKNKPSLAQKKKKNRAPAPHDRCGAVGVGDLVKRPRRVCETRRPRLVAGRGLGRRRDDLPEPARDVPQECAGARGEAVPGKQGGPGQRRGESSKIVFGFFLSFVHLLFFFQEETRNDEIKISPSLLLSLPLSTSNSPLLSSLTRTINKTNQ